MFVKYWLSIVYVLLNTQICIRYIFWIFTILDAFYLCITWCILHCVIWNICEFSSVYFHLQLKKHHKYKFIKHVSLPYFWYAILHKMQIAENRIFWKYCGIVQKYWILRKEHILQKYSYFLPTSKKCSTFAS